MKQLRIIILLLFSLLPALTAAGERPLVPYEGDAKDFSLTDYKGNKHRLEDYRGQVVLINFWASWCTPCILEMPELVKLKDHMAQQPIASQSFKILTINVGERKNRVTQAVARFKLNLPVLLDISSKTYDSWDIKMLPTSFLIDANGIIRYRIVGNPGWDNEQMLSLIKDLILENKHDGSTNSLD